MVLGVRCHMSRITCHLPLMPTATATDPAPAHSPTMHSRLVCIDQNPKNIKLQKNQQNNQEQNNV